MTPVFHFDTSSILIAIISALVTGAVYYIKQEIRTATGAGLGPLADKIEKIALEMMSKFDALTHALNQTNVTLGRADERLVQTDRAIVSLDGRMTRAEDNISELRTFHGATR